jgi:hypothetical protein
MYIEDVRATAEWLTSMRFSLVHCADAHARIYDGPREEVLRLLLRTVRSVVADAHAPRQLSVPR